MLTAIHLGHAGKDAKLREAADVLWPESTGRSSKRQTIAQNVSEQLRTNSVLDVKKRSERYLRPILQTRRRILISFRRLFPKCIERKTVYVSLGG